MIELGSYAAYYTVGGFLNKTQEGFIKSLKNNYQRVSDLPLNEEQIVAWQDCFNVLHSSLSKLPESFNNLWLIFEYVLPNHKPGGKKALFENHIRADVIMVSESSILVMEFKQREDPFEGLFSQAKKYKTRIERYHVESADMFVDSLLILTKAENYIDVCDGVVGVSPDRLHFSIKDITGAKPRPYRNITKWLNSDFAQLPSPPEQSNYFTTYNYHDVIKYDASTERYSILFPCHSMEGKFIWMKRYFSEDKLIMLTQQRAESITLENVKWLADYCNMNPSEERLQEIVLDILANEKAGYYIETPKERMLRKLKEGTLDYNTFLEIVHELHGTKSSQPKGSSEEPIPESCDQFQVDANDYHIGAKVHHTSFGFGTVTALEGQRLRVHFDSKDAVFLFPDCIEKGYIKLSDADENSGEH